jgi:hypothetical protein
MKNEVKKGNSLFSEILIEKMREKLENNEQVILFLNRRGFSSYQLCSSCGEVIKCPNCDITLTYHKTSGMNRCHYCGYAEKKKAGIYFNAAQTEKIFAKQSFDKCIDEMANRRYGSDLVIRAEICKLLVGILRTWQEGGFVIGSEAYAEDNVIIKDEEISQTSVIHIGKANDTTEHYHYTGDGIERTLTNLVA